MSLKIAFVIPCRNEEKYIAQCLQSLVALEYPREQLEIWVCDGKSTDQTAAIIQGFAEKYSFIRLLINEKQTTPFALNLGIKAAKADVVTILGAHAEVDSMFAAYCAEVLVRDATVGCVGGIIENVNENEVAGFIASAMRSPFGVGNAHFRTGAKDGYVDTVAFGAYRRQVFEEIGLFDEDLTRNQDDEFNYRLLSAGWKIYLDRRIKSRYFVRGAWDKLWKQYYQYGYWKVLVNRKHRAVTTIRQLIPMIFVAGLCLGAALSFLHHYFLYCYLLGVSLYLLGAAAAAYLTQKDMLNIPNTMRAFIILHLSYGIGYWHGIWDFLILKKSKAITKQTEMSR